jgi:hypothetical protein
MKRLRIATWYPIVLIVLFGLVVLYPLFRSGFPVTDDGDWMIIRLSAFFQSLRQGQFPVRFLGRLNLNYGYPVANFLYPGFMYIGSVFYMIGLSYIDSVKLVMIASVLGSATAVFLWLRKSFSALAAIIGAVSLIFAPYVSFDIYKRGSVGEILAVFAASLLFLATGSQNTVYVAFATALLTVSHNTLALMFLAVYLVYLSAERKFREMPAVLLGLMMSAFFWAPALIEKGYVRFDTVTVSNPFEYFASGARVTLLPVAAIVAFLLLVFSAKPAKRKGLHIFMYIFSAVLFFATPVSAPLWNIEPFSRLVQFPYRFLALALIAGAWISASFVDRLPRWRLAAFVGMLVILLIQWRISLVPVIIADKPESFYSTNEATTTVADEYMPRWVESAPQTRPSQKMEFIRGNGTIAHMRPGTDILDFEVYSESAGVLRINKIYYPGWGVTVNGNPVPVSVIANDGVMQVPVGAGTSRVEADFRETPGRFVADSISLAAVILAVVLLVTGFFRKRKEKGR